MVPCFTKLYKSKSKTGDGLKRKMFFLIILLSLPLFEAFPQDLTITTTQNLSTGTYNNLTINGSGIVVTLTGTVTVNGVLTLTNGIITSSSSNLLSLGPNATVTSDINNDFGGNINSYVDGPVEVSWPATGANITKRFPIGDNSKYRPVKIRPVAASSQTIRCEVVYANCGGTPGTGLAAISPFLYFKTLVTSGSAGSVMIELGYYPEDGVEDSKSIRVGRNLTTVNGVYENIGSSGMGFSFNSYPGGVNNVYTMNDAGEFLVHATTDAVKNPLPVELLSFSAAVNEKNVELEWKTATETNNRGYDIERSQSGNWEKIGFVSGGGNTTSSKVYKFVDGMVTIGKYSYRLKQIDFDGSSKYLKEIEVEIGTLMDFSLSQNFPNPFNPGTEIQFNIPENNFVTLKVYNALGSEVVTLVNKRMNAGSYKTTFDGNGLSSGVYFFRLQAGNFVDIKKATLMK